VIIHYYNHRKVMARFLLGPSSKVEFAYRRIVIMVILQYSRGLHCTLWIHSFFSLMPLSCHFRLSSVAHLLMQATCLSEWSNNFPKCQCSKSILRAFHSAARSPSVLAGDQGKVDGQYMCSVIFSL
jgi:hypothetical protein